jgi:hypothetical protein
MIEYREHDLLNCETARYTTEKKDTNDKLKLILETRCNLDHLIACCSHASPQKLRMNYLQVCRNKMDVFSLRLVDHGLYINETVDDLSIPISISEFKVNYVEWFSLLLSLVVCLFSIKKKKKKKALLYETNTHSFTILECY